MIKGEQLLILRRLNLSPTGLNCNNFTGIELQTMDTTGTVWPERQRLLNEHGFPVDRVDSKTEICPECSEPC
ncbi:MAG: hypothetical protein IJ801_08015 [Lachnospiraceae bacterium]|nr:hypothetical protein [Lachnospiraceae bacterium]